MIQEIETINWAEGSEPKVLNEIHRSTTNISIYNREISHLDVEINELLVENAEIQTSGEPKLIQQYLKEKLSAYPLILDDLLTLIEHFKLATEATSYRVLLATVNTNMCRKFHSDINDLRMLCTYSGPGTLWLKNDNVNWKELNALSSVQDVAIDESKAEQAKRGSVIILKGALYPNDQTSAIIHRSPTIEETGTRRLLLRIDTNEFLNFNL